MDFPTYLRSGRIVWKSHTGPAGSLLRALPGIGIRDAHGKTKTMAVEQISRKDLPRARALVESGGLSYEEAWDDLVGVYRKEEICGVGARLGNILKMIVIRPEDRGGPLLGELVTELIRLGLAAGKETFFIFTSPANLSTFEALGFAPLAVHPQAALLEYGGGLKNYLQAHRHLVRPGNNGAVVVNCNPFTLGHRFLIEEAARRVENLYVFVVREDRSVFPFEVRLQLVRKGVADLANVVCLDSSDYAISAVTFPAYFLRASDDAAQIQMELDLLLFARHLAPFFHIERRFLGTEPYCRTTRLYGEAMQRILPEYGIEAVLIERRQIGGKPVSAHRVREALRREDFETVRQLVPPATLNYLLSPEAAELRERLRTYDGRH